MSALDTIIKNLGYDIVKSSEQGFGTPEERAKNEIKILVIETIEEVHHKHGFNITELIKAVSEL
jgi:hypothetical protein